MTQSTADPKEIAGFSALATEWWAANGPMQGLHKLNPLRLRYVRDRAVAHFGANAASVTPLKGLRALDIGCGAGLLSEPLARLGAQVTGIDASPDLIAAARSHAAASGLTIDYRESTAEILPLENSFDLVIASEVIEHVSDPALFLQACSHLLAPGSLFILSTLNRTRRSFALAIVGAEYVLRVVPRGTHNWRKFLKPSEVGRMLRQNGIETDDVTGMTLNPVLDIYRLGPDTSVNYLLSAHKPPA